MTQAGTFSPGTLVSARGREWMIGHFNAPIVTELTLKLYAEVARAPKPA